MKRNFNKILIAGTAMIAAVACNNNAEWTLKGNISGVDGDGNVVVLEGVNAFGNWQAVDSLKVDSDGDFSTEQPAQTYPDIFRLNYGGRYIYFPIDSIDNLTVEAEAGAFDTKYTLTGSEDADMICKVDGRINEFVAKNGVAALDTAVSLKRELSEMVLSNPSSVVAYYIVQKQVKGQPLFRKDVRKELGVIGAVTNAYTENRPSDPRTQYLKNVWFANVSRAVASDTIVATEINLIDITGLDNKGVQQSLNNVAAKNKVVLLVFTGYSDSYFQVLNAELQKLWTKHHSAGFEIFQLGFDVEEMKWRIAADQQPWITVWNGNTDLHLRNYNVGQLPAVFVISNGGIAERATNLSSIESIVAKYL